MPHLYDLDNFEPKRKNKKLKPLQQSRRVVCHICGKEFLDPRQLHRHKEKSHDHK